MSRDEVFVALRSFVASELLDGKDIGLDGTTQLLEWGIIDSFSLVKMLAFIETKFGIKVPSDKVKPEYFGTLDGIVRLLVPETARSS